MANYWLDDEFGWDFHDKKFLTNFERRDLPIYQTAIQKYRQQYTDNDFHIEEIAYDVNGEILPILLSLHARFNKDCSEFWLVFNSIRKHYPSPWSFRFNKPPSFIKWKNKEEDLLF